DPRILPEMSAKVSFLSRAIAPGDQTPRTAVPRNALRRVGNKVTAFRVNGGQVSEVSLRTGIALGDLIEITSGLAVGDRVVINPPKNLKTGAAVTINEK
ncbi:MAG: efflux RND transporter periplasmic adaptor subunit, partial [Syntrophales bacterium]|nr:efflux RND transporter periplasmic adaptor subunit [Syntrophales bacterium]